jgi:hypothetical protein
VSFSSTRLRATFVLLFCFFAGLVVGVIGDHVVLLHSRRLLPPHGKALVRMIGSRMDRELDLTDAQRREVDSILERHQQAIETLTRNVQPQVHQELMRANGEIERLLDEPQKVKYRKLRERFHARAQQFMK